MAVILLDPADDLVAVAELGGGGHGRLLVGHSQDDFRDGTLESELVEWQCAARVALNLCLGRRVRFVGVGRARDAEGELACVGAAREVHAVGETSAADCNPHGTFDGVHVALGDEEGGQVRVRVGVWAVGGEHCEGGVDGGDGHNVGGGTWVLANFAEVIATVVKGLERLRGVERSGEGVPGRDGVGQSLEVAGDLDAEVLGAVQGLAKSRELGDDLVGTVLE